MSQQYMLAVVRSKIAIALFIGDGEMWQQAIKQYFSAIGGKTTHRKHLAPVVCPHPQRQTMRHRNPIQYQPWSKTNEQYLSFKVGAD